MKYVYHGSHSKFDIAKPHSTTRGSIKNGKQVINYLNTSYANYVGTCIKEMIGDKLRNRLAFL